MAIAHFVPVISHCRRLDRFRRGDLTEPSSASRILDLDGLGYVDYLGGYEGTGYYDTEYAAPMFVTQESYGPTFVQPPLTGPVSNTRVRMARIRGFVRSVLDRFEGWRRPLRGGCIGAGRYCALHHA
jgi:hypothetical protein